MNQDNTQNPNQKTELDRQNQHTKKQEQNPKKGQPPQDGSRRDAEKRPGEFNRPMSGQH